MFTSAQEMTQLLDAPNILKNKVNLVQNNLPLFRMLVSSALQFVKSLENMMSPYFLPLFHTLLFFSDFKNYGDVVASFSEKLAETLSARVLIEKTFSILEISQNISPLAVKMCGFYLTKVFSKMEAEDIEEF